MSSTVTLPRSSRLPAPLAALLACAMSCISPWMAIGTVHAAAHPAQAVVENAVTEALDVLRARKDELVADSGLLRSEIDRLIVPHVDFDSTTKLAVGRLWLDADATQREELKKDFKELLLSTYSGALKDYSGQDITFEPFRPESRDDRATVRSTFVQKGAARDVPIEYKLREKDGEWKIYDVIVNGIDLVASYRNAFAAEAERGGVEGLIAALKKKIDENDV